MSIYAALKFPIPVMAYCALHQVKGGKDPEDYKKTMQDLHRLLREQTEGIQKHWDAYCSEAQERTVQATRGLLSPFLTTPLQSDSDEIRQILKDQIVDYGRQLIPGHRYGVVKARETRILNDYEGTGLTRKLLLSGKAYLKELQFQTGKNSLDVFESSFQIEGGMNFDVIEHLVRDRIGIYTPVHGKHIKEFDAYAYAAYNLIFNPEPKTMKPAYEASIYFSKGSTHYEPFRNGLSDLLTDLSSLAWVISVAAWQRKLGLGVGREFVLRVFFTEEDKVLNLVDMIAANAGKAFVKDAILGGHLLLKEIVA